MLRENAYCNAQIVSYKYVDKTNLDACAQYCENNKATILVYRKDNGGCGCCHNPPREVVPDTSRQNIMYHKKISKIYFDNLTDSTTIKYINYHGSVI